MQFKYLAVYQNRTIEGFIEAEDKKEALLKLRNQNLTVIHLEEVAAKKRNVSITFLERFTRDLLQLLKAGLSIDKALLLIAESEKKYSQDLLKAYNELIKGSPIFQALATTNLFPRDYIELIRAGEESGNLIETLELLHNFLHETNEFRKNILNALIYPSFLMFVTIASLIILSMYVIPKFKLLFEASEVELPLVTKLVFLISDYLNYIFIFTFSFLLILLLSIRILMYKAQTRKLFEHFIIKIPIIGKLILIYDLIKVSNSMYTLIKGGVPLDKAINIAKNIPSLYTLRELFNQLLNAVLRGESISSVLSKSTFIPDVVVEIIKVGEESGELAGAWFQAYISMSDDFQTTVRRIITLLEPAVILITGLFVGFIVFGMILGVFTISGSV